MIHLINTITVAIAAALVAVIIDNTATARNSIEFVATLILSIALFVCYTLSKLWPVTLKDIYLIYFGHPGSILSLAQKCMIAKKDFWSTRDYIFWGQRTCILTSEKSVHDVLTNGSVFQRVKAPGDSITSPHSILGAGGVSNTWKRLRGICRPYFNKGEFEEANDKLVEHVIKAVEHALKESPKGGIDLFQLINRLVVEAHLLTILGIDSVEAEGKDIPVRDYIDSDKMSSKCMADIIDDSLNVEMAEPKFSSVAFAPMMTWLTDRLMLPPEQLGGIEKILAQAQRNGELSTMERLHNCIMYMIALAPSPASFWTIVHVYKQTEYLDQIRDESDDGKFSTLAMCVKETLRMYAPVPIMVTRYVRTKKESNKKCPASLLTGHDKVDLKDGDRVLIPTIILQNDPYLWKNPNKYDPDRFEAPENLSIVGKANSLLLKGSGIQPRPRAKSVRSLKSRANARYFPFGQGKHTCLGQPYASWLTMTITSTIFNNFNMEIEDVEGLLEKEFSYQRIKDHVYTFPKSPFMAKISSLDQEVQDSMTRKENFRKSMMANMQEFSQFFQEREDDDDSDDDEAFNPSLTRRANISKAIVEDEDEEEVDWE